MPYVLIKRKPGQAEDDLPLLSPEMTQEDCEKQVAHLNEHVVPHRTQHIDEEGEEHTTIHKPQGRGTPDMVHDLGWCQILADTIHSAEVVRELPAEYAGGDE